MDIGLFHQMWAPPGIADKEFFAQTVADVQLAETLSFESCSFGILRIQIINQPKFRN